MPQTPTHLIKPPNTHANQANDWPLTSAFLLHCNSKAKAFRFSEIEMIKLQPSIYTSLKDLLPASPPFIISPTKKSGCGEIPIKNPLVKHAALACLRPMSGPPKARGKGLLGKLRNLFCCQCECFSWINDIVSWSVKQAFWDGHMRKKMKTIRKLTETDNFVSLTGR